MKFLDDLYAKYTAKTSKEKIDRIWERVQIKNNRMGLGFEQKEAEIGQTKRVMMEIITDLDPTFKNHTGQMTDWPLKRMEKEMEKAHERWMEHNIGNQKEARAMWRMEKIEWEESL
ncbi:hypothetical protein BpHYR1_050887 [Brachionus plicatilis]|uniref:Uncharacterized protein n=1 Tax=Brachionus plicatilis TaxID=10195 RepID=A0A3M7PUT6_BRAPC|nr:hypothetical protein BpHYR1_050887 [Brachionus plicatilis]